MPENTAIKTKRAVMTKEQARAFVKAEKNKMTPAQIHENSVKSLDRLISQDFLQRRYRTYLCQLQSGSGNPFLY